MTKNEFQFGKFNLTYLLVILISVVVLIGLVLLVGRGGISPKSMVTKPTNGEGPVSNVAGPGNLPVSTPEPGKAPPTLPAIKDENKANLLKDYFAKVSPNNFRAEFIGQIPDASVPFYEQYVGATDPENKRKFAQSFYIILSGPKSGGDNSQFTAFTNDVKSDLEKSLGKSLF